MRSLHLVALAALTGSVPAAAMAEVQARNLDALVAEMMAEDLKVMAHAPVMHNA